MTVSGLEPRVDRWWAQTDSFSSVGGTPNNNASTASSKKTESQIILEILILSLLNTIASNTTSNQRDGVF